MQLYRMSVSKNNTITKRIGKIWEVVNKLFSWALVRHVSFHACVYRRRSFYRIFNSLDRHTDTLTDWLMTILCSATGVESRNTSCCCVDRKAKELIGRIMSKGHDLPDFQSDGHVTLEMMIPGNKAGIVIGKGGETIKLLQVTLVCLLFLFLQRQTSITERLRVYYMLQFGPKSCS